MDRALPHMFRERSIIMQSEGSPNWAEFIPSESSRPTGGHGNGKTPIEPCGPSANLGVERCLLGVMWEALTVKPRGMDDGYPELLFWRKVYTDVKDDPSSCGTI